MNLQFQDEVFFEKLAEVFPEALFAFQGKTFLYMNNAGLSLLGMNGKEELQQYSADQFFSEELLKTLKGKKINAETLSTDNFSEQLITDIHGHTKIVEISLKQIILHHEQIGLLFAKDISELKKTEHALLQSQERYQNFIKTSLVGIYRLELLRPMSIAFSVDEQIRILTEESVLIECNLAFAQMQGYQRVDEVIGLKLFEIRGFDKKLLEKNLRKLIARNYIFENEEITERISTGGLKWFLVSSSAKIDRMKLIRIWGTQIDITQRKDIEYALAQNENKYRVIAETSPNAVCTTDIKGNITYASPKAVEVFKAKVSREIEGLNALEMITPEQRDSLTRHMVLVLRRGNTGEKIYQFKRVDESLFYGELNVSSMTDKEGFPYGFICIIKDVTDKKMAEYEIKRYQRKLKTLNAELTLAEEKERRRIAVDLHDEIGQSLSIAYLKLSAMLNQPIDNELKKKIGESAEFVNEAIVQSRSLTYELSPPILYELGLIAAIKWRLEQVREKYGLNISFRSSEKKLELDPEIKILIYRVVCELLVNIVKHAQADLVKIEVSKDQNYIYISVLDNGIGFDHHKETTVNQYGGFGLFSIKERLDSIEGYFVIDSEKDTGTNVMVIVPA